MDDQGPRGSRWLPPRRDLALAGVFGALSLLQVLEDPIAGPVASVVVAVGSTFPLAWRRRRPAAAAVAGSVVWLVPTEGFLFLGYLIAVLLYFSVGNEIRRLRTVAAVTGAGVALGAVATLLSSQPPYQVLATTLAVVGPVVAGRLVAHQRAQTSRLEQLAGELRRERAAAERAAAAAERSRIARELHDVVGHELTVIALQADAAAAALARAPERAAAPVAAIRHAAADALAEMRTVLGVLRTEAGRDLRPQPGFPDLRALVEQSRSAGTEVSLTLQPRARDVPATVQLAAYRVVQESLTNASRHAPGASVRVCVDGDDRAVVVEVVDTGGGPGSTGGAGLGLVGMRERVRVLGGELSAGPRPGGGFAVNARLPLDAPAGT